MLEEMHFPLIDTRVQGINVMVQMSVRDYYSLAKEIDKKNPYQRRKVGRRAAVYVFLKDDLIKGCVIPPIVLATTDRFAQKYSETIGGILSKGTIDPEDEETIADIINEAVSQHEIMILDGLQRTNSIEEALEEAKGQQKEKLEEQLLRFEVYLGLRKAGLLYRMLTLNTGQTPMPFRHQLEIVFADYLNRDDLPSGISLVKQVDRTSARSPGTYKFSDAIDMYHSFKTGEIDPTDKKTILNRLEKLDVMESLDNESNEEMITLVQCYDAFIKITDENSEGWTLSKEELDVLKEDLKEDPFGKDVYKVFGRSQAMSGFGAAAWKLVGKKEEKPYKNIDDLLAVLSGYEPSARAIRRGMKSLLVEFSKVTAAGRKAKIGTYQRAYFEVFFREFFNPDSDGYLNIQDCPSSAYRRFKVLY